MKVAELFAAFGIEVEQKSVQNVNNTFNKVKSSFTKILGALGIGLSLKNMNQIIEEFNGLNKTIRASIDETENFEEATRGVLDAANGARVSYSLMAKSVSDLKKSNSGMFSTSEATQYQENVIKLMKASGKADSEIQTIISSLNSSFAKGKVEATAINKIIEASPKGAEILAKKIGTTKDNLKTMAASGTISLSQLKGAFLDASEDINGFFNESGMTVSEALTVIRNKWGAWLADADKELGVTKTIAKTMVSFFEKVISFLDKVKNGVVWLSQKVGGLENLLKLLLIIGSSLFVVFNFTKIIAFLKTIFGMFSLGNLKLMAIAAIVVLIVLLIEDFITWINGGDSVFGTLFGDWGPIADGVCQFFSDAWDWCCKIFDKFAKGDWEGAMTDIGEAVCTGWTNIFETIDGIFGTHLADWMKECQQFFREFGSYLYASTHQEELKEIEASGKYGSLDSEVLQQANAYMRAGLGSEEAFEKAKNEIVTSTEALAYWNTHFQDDALKVQAEQNRTTMLENGLLTINVYTDDELRSMGMEEYITKATGMPSNVPKHAGGTSNAENVFIAGEKGPELVTGAKGMSVLTALQTSNVIRNLNALASAQYVSAPTSKVASSSNTEIKNITQNVEINNQFNGDRAIQKEAATAMDKSADDITDTLSRGLAYTR